ncbi:uncharacterized protein [Dysidea avara]|uniref:uncharacterized protein n=1 Tax=Dysidea avara TaxID=196820 RepID=UPI0033194979
MEESSEGNNNKHHHHYDDNENNDDSDDEEEEGEEGENNSGNSGFFNTYELEVPISVTSSSNSSSAINFVLGETSSMVTGVHEHREQEQLSDDETMQLTDRQTQSEEHNGERLLVDGPIQVDED